MMDTHDRHDELIETRFARELRGQFETLAQTAGAHERRHRRRRRFIFIAVTILGAGIALGGAALAGAFDSSSPAPWPEPSLPAESVYPTNAAGETYGTSEPLVEEPDLVAAIGRHGVHGYLRTSDIDGDPPDTPEEAAEQTKRGLRGYTVPLYGANGVTVVGEFQVGGSDGQMRMKQADGTVITMEADHDGNIITTTTHPDGSVTIETEALDGTRTTKELTATEAKRLAQNQPTPTPQPSHKSEPDRPRPELLEHMSRLAREVGDARATAWWELQFRYYLKPIEGDKTPDSPYQQWASVWLVILHGNFDGPDWRYWLLDRDSYDVVSSGASNKRFVMSGPHLPAPQGPIALNSE